MSNKTGPPNPRGFSLKQIFILGVILILLAAAFFAWYLLYYLPRKGPGIVKYGRAEMGPLKFEMSIYGPGGGDLPKFTRPNSVTLNDKRIYITDTGNNRVCVFNRKGAFLFAFGGFGNAYASPGKESDWRPGTFNYPAGIDVSDDGRVYVADVLNQRIQVFDESGSPLFWFPFLEEGERSRCYPVELDVEGGYVYVCDNLGQRVAIYDLEGRFKTSVGAPGREEGFVESPAGVAVDTAGDIFVTDKLNMTVSAFAPGGKLLWVKGRVPRSQNESQRFFGLPSGAAVHGKYIFVVDAFNFTIKIFSKAGEYLGEFGSRGTGDGSFNFSRGLRAYKGYLGIADMENNRIQIFKINDDKLRQLKPVYK